MPKFRWCAYIVYIYSMHVTIKQYPSVINMDSRNALKKWGRSLCILCCFSDWGVSYGGKEGISWSCRWSFYCPCHDQGALTEVCWKLTFLFWHLLLLFGLWTDSYSLVRNIFQIPNVLWVAASRMISLYLHFSLKKAAAPVLWKQSYKRRAWRVLCKHRSTHVGR